MARKNIVKAGTQFITALGLEIETIIDHSDTVLAFNCFGTLSQAVRAFKRLPDVKVERDHGYCTIHVPYGVVTLSTDLTVPRSERTVYVEIQHDADKADLYDFARTVAQADPRIKVQHVEAWLEGGASSATNNRLKRVAKQVLGDAVYEAYEGGGYLYDALRYKLRLSKVREVNGVRVDMTPRQAAKLAWA